MICRGVGVTVSGPPGVGDAPGASAVGVAVFGPPGVGDGILNGILDKP